MCLDKSDIKVKKVTVYLLISATSYPAATASKLAGTAAVKSSLGFSEAFASPINASDKSYR